SWSTRYFPYLQEVGLPQLEGLTGFTPDPHLITALVGRWRSETNTLYMFHGECTITLEDVVILTSLLVTGEAAYVEYEKEMDWAVLVGEVLGETPVAGLVKADRRLKIWWLRDRFYSCSDIKDGDPALLVYACAYMLGIIRPFFLAD
ncbi:Serine/threonine-protein phosphatase 7 long form homolog, partial [Linum grandiflorum]